MSQTTSTRYFAYDEMNRQTVVDAEDTSLNLGQVGHLVTYDKAGNRTSDTYWGDFGYLANGAWQKGTGLKVEIYGYDAQNRLITTDTRGYDAGRASTDASGAAHEDSLSCPHVHKARTPPRAHPRLFFDARNRLNPASEPSIRRAQAFFGPVRHLSGVIGPRSLAHVMWTRGLTTPAASPPDQGGAPCHHLT